VAAAAACAATRFPVPRRMSGHPQDTAYILLA